MEEPSCLDYLSLNHNILVATSRSGGYNIMLECEWEEGYNT